jgi:hypothetical protein
MVGTVIGAVAIVVLTAVFPQERLGFLVGLALWCAACGLVATLLRNFAAYAASLAGFTAAIVASDELGAVGGASCSQVVRGHVEGISRGIKVANAQPDPAGLASVNPIFTWVRLAQRLPVRIHIDHVPDGVRLVAGMTATVQIDRNPNRQGGEP